MILLFHLRTAAKFSAIFLSHPMHRHSARGLRTANMLVTVMCAFVFFIAIIPAYLLCQMWANPPAVINSLELCSSSKGKRKFCHGFLTSSMKCEMWHFQVIVMQWQQRNVQKACCMCKVHMLSSLLDPILFFWWTFLLPSSLILFALFSINVGRCLYVWTPILVLILVFVYFLCGIRKYSCVIKNNRKMQTI